jgi:hypothetical protein
MNTNKTNWLQIMQNFYNSEDYHLVQKLAVKDNSREALELVKLSMRKYEELLNSEVAA